MRLTVLQVAYSVATVGRDAAGGAEQILSMLDLELTRRGHHSLVVACEGSRVAGTLLPTPEVTGPLDRSQMKPIHQRHRQVIEEALSKWPVNLIHTHGLDFYESLPARSSPPVLATL